MKTVARASRPHANFNHQNPPLPSFTRQTSPEPIDSPARSSHQALFSCVFSPIRVHPRPSTFIGGFISLHFFLCVPSRPPRLCVSNLFAIWNSEPGTSNKKTPLSLLLRIVSPSCSKKEFQQEDTEISPLEDFQTHSWPIPSRFPRSCFRNETSGSPAQSPSLPPPSAPSCSKSLIFHLRNENRGAGVSPACQHQPPKPPLNPSIAPREAPTKPSSLVSCVLQSCVFSPIRVHRWFPLSFLASCVLNS